jgi:hypothetical protein
VRPRFGYFFQHYESQSIFDLLGSLIVLESKLNSTLRVVVELDLIFILFELLLIAESFSNLLVSLVFLTLGITLNELLSIGPCAGSLNVPPQVTLTVESYLCLACNFRTRLVRMAGSLASVNAIFSNLIASRATAIGLQLFLTGEAFTREMAVLLAGMTTQERLFALGTTA